MEIQYYKDAKHNYLIMSTEVSEENLFQYKMLENNRIDGLLPFSLRNMDESYYLYYEIDSKQSLKNRYGRKKMSYERLLNLFEGLSYTAKHLGDYLLDPCHILLSPDGIFEELSTGRFLFIYDPCHEENADQAFVESLMDYVDMEDEKGVKLIYKLLDSFYDGSGIDFTFLESVVAEERKEEKDTFVIDEMPMPKTQGFYDHEYNEDEEPDEKENEKTSEKKIKIKLPIGTHFLLAMLFAIVAAALVYLRYAYVLTYEESLLDIAVFMVSTMMSLTCFLIQIRKNDKAFTKTKKEIDDEDEESVEEPLSTIKENVISYDVAYGKGKETVKKYMDDIAVEDESEETVLLTLDFNGRLHKLYAAEGTNQPNIDLGNLPAVIGKLASCADIIVNDKSVSRMHAKIYRPNNSDDLWIQDLNSTNGTYVNGKRLMPNEEISLKEDDEISFGKCVYAYR